MQRDATETRNAFIRSEMGNDKFVRSGAQRRKKPIRFVLTGFRTFAAVSTEVKDVSYEFERRRPRERHTIDHQGSPSAVHRAGPEGFLVHRNLETNFPKLSATFADHTGESQFSPCKDQDIIRHRPDKTPTTDREASQGTNLHLTEPNMIANFPVRSQLS